MAIVIDRDILEAFTAGKLATLEAQMARNANAVREQQFAEQNALLAQQASASKAMAESWPSPQQHMVMSLFASCLEARKTSLTTATTDTTLRDVGRDAAVMTMAAWVELRPMLEALE